MNLSCPGSAYTYSYATMGELVAWIIGWDLILEYLVGAATVAVGWSGYFVSFFQVAFSIDLGKRFTSPPLHWDEPTLSIIYNPDGIINLPGLLIVLVLTIILVLGIRESKWLNNVIVIIKLLTVLLFIFAGIKYVDPKNWRPFVPPATTDGDWRHFGAGGIFAAAQSVFFAYIGFDAVSTAAQESKRPERDLPVGIMVSLGVCTVLYICTALVLTGIVPYAQLNVEAPVALACVQTGMKWLEIIVTLGALGGLTSVMLIMLLAQPRIFHTMAHDGLLPPIFARVHRRFRTPYVPTLVSGAVTAALGALLPVDLLGNMTSVGTLLAFLFVHVGIVVLRFSRPDVPRKFRIPGPGFVWMVFPVVGAAVSVLLIAVADRTTIWRLFAWMAIGLIFYAVYGFRKSNLGHPKSTVVPVLVSEKLSASEGFAKLYIL
ncbi:hypothetical protein BC936DRAFT_148805 [Jimgerdemannia flammicorona]|uniref:Amino acid/polyamine transporter I n=1 Tax=Jimgerdemannia flammicorona TaxID=994334 RepID=A0A433DKI3_9FUNG|nr:hypothetical protein BC936DRAFT_148805 [Jimgerdemannia flammicorona]RUP51317.1 hypothetical protein BC936DRAFT_148805 [Jimgerdemannia flammicorona]